MNRWICIAQIGITITTELISIIKDIEKKQS